MSAQAQSIRSEQRASSFRTVPLGTFHAVRISGRSPIGLWDQEISAIYDTERHVRLPAGVAPKPGSNRDRT
jgi:hypothetical protein